MVFCPEHMKEGAVTVITAPSVKKLYLFLNLLDKIRRQIARELFQEQDEEGDFVPAPIGFAGGLSD